MNIHTNKTEKTQKNTPVFFRWQNALFIALLLAAAFIWLLLGKNAPSGAVAQVTVTMPNTQRSMEISLDENTEINIEDSLLPVTLLVKDGAIRFVHSQCPDGLCENFGWISKEGEWALCAPAGVSVRII